MRFIEGNRVIRLGSVVEGETGRDASPTYVLYDSRAETTRVPKFSPQEVAAIVHYAVNSSISRGKRSR